MYLIRLLSHTRTGFDGFNANLKLSLIVIRLEMSAMRFSRFQAP